MMEIVNKKRQDVQHDYIKEMMDKFNVVIHTAALTGAEKSESNEKINKPAK
jgi:dTDP-4-dehydrorhamnose reductase